MDCYRVGLAVQREISAQRPAAFAGGFRGRGFEDDFLMLIAIEDIGAEHGGLPLWMDARTSCSCPKPEKAPVLPTWIVMVDFCVSMLRCWALRPRAQSRVAAAANKVRRIAHLEWNFDLKIIWAYWAERFVLNRKSVLLCFQ
jgi:hypothetical protein